MYDDFRLRSLKMNMHHLIEYLFVYLTTINHILCTKNRKNAKKVYSTLGLKGPVLKQFIYCYLGLHCGPQNFIY